jgi:hypothetical protein
MSREKAFFFEFSIEQVMLHSRPSRRAHSAEDSLPEISSDFSDRRTDPSCIYFIGSTAQGS